MAQPTVSPHALDRKIADLRSRMFREKLAELSGGEPGTEGITDEERRQAREWLERRRGRHTITCAVSCKVGPAGELLWATCQCGLSCHECRDQYDAKRRAGLLRVA